MPTWMFEILWKILLTRSEYWSALWVPGALIRFACKVGRSYLPWNDLNFNSCLNLKFSMYLCLSQLNKFKLPPNKNIRFVISNGVIYTSCPRAFWRRSYCSHDWMIKLNGRIALVESLRWGNFQIKYVFTGTQSKCNKILRWSLFTNVHIDLQAACYWAV